MKRTSLIFLLGACLQTPFVVANENPPAPDSSRHPPTGSFNRTGLQELAGRAERELRGNILPFWLKYTRDTERGGFYGLIDSNMTVHKDEPRGALLTSRILWTFSTAYRVYRDPQYLEMARWACRDLTEKFTDKEFGGLYWTITADGKPLDTRKQIYGQVFGLYALAEYYRATGEKPALDQAIAIYRLVEKYAHDRSHGGYLDAFDQKWRQNDSGNVLGRAPKSQNSHIHILEAYTNLLRAWPDAELRANQRDLIDVTLKHIIDPRTHHLVLFMKEDWTPISEEISYGHDIELSWLLVEAAEVLGDHELLTQIRPVALAIAQATLAEGTDTDGAILNEGNAHGVTSTRKDWWPQAEAAVGYLNAYQLSQDPRYFAAARRSWDFIEARFVDRVHGDWFESLNRDGTPLPRPKVSLWHCPYHNGRSCFEVIERVQRMTEVEAAR
jgi:mannobiose 2-epimerase